ncbi:MAG: class I SAM-dependent methyltransferase [Flavobacterium sp.]|nr:class I SAM-dependent methyltransferase [Flavobacterium sp.]
MDLKRKPLQGVANIIRFNWHFYLVAVLVFVGFIYAQQLLPKALQLYVFWLLVLAIVNVVMSLLVSFYVYDISNLYQLNWLPNASNKKVLNIHAGFDETSMLIKCKYQQTALTICDFYNPQKHTEISIKRARKAYPPIPNTIHVATENLPFENNSFDVVAVIFSAHEIRDKEERIEFFKELARVIKATGQIVITEHLRDTNNFLAYAIGFFHFYSKASWLSTFAQANLTVTAETKTTPFVTTFILTTNGNSL